VQPAQPPDPAGGGDPPDDTFGESLSESQYALLSEAGKAGFVQKHVTVHRGSQTFTQTRWVRPEPPTPAPTPAAPAETAPHERRARQAAAAEHNLSRVVERPQTKPVAAARQYADVARRRRVIHAVKNEGELAAAIGGHNLPDSEPADVVHIVDATGKALTDRDAIRAALRQREESVKALKTGLSPYTGQPLGADQRAAYEARLKLPAHFFEVKTLLTSKADAVRMSAKAMKRKERWMDKFGVSFSVVAIDDRKGKKHSGNRVYVAPHELGGTTRLEHMRPVASLADVLGTVRESRVAEARGAPPWPGAVFNELSHRWENPGRGKDPAEVMAGVPDHVQSSWHAVKSQLTADERERVEQYTDSPAQFNRPLIAGEKSSDTQRRRIAALDSAIAKAPPFAEPVLLHRGFRVKADDPKTADFVARLAGAAASGDPLAIPTYLSGSADSAVGERYRGSGTLPGETPVALEIVARHGLFLDPISAHDNPLKEVLLPRGSTFRVTAREQGGLTVYRLEQLG
jgi:hypothetical protein